MQVQREVTQIQAAIVLISTIVGVGVLALPRLAALSADAGAPLLTFVGVLMAYVALFSITLLGLRFPDESIITYSEQIIGKWIAWLFNSIVILFFAVLTALTAREFGEVVVSAVLQKTPLEVSVIIMLLLAMLSSRNNLTTFTYIHHLYFPLIIFPAILIAVLSLKNANPLYLQPLIGNEPRGFMVGSLMIAALFQGSFIYTFIIPAMRQPIKALRASGWGFVIAGGLYILIVIATVGVFGPEETKRMLWPTLELAKTTSLPGGVLERLDAAFIAVWVTAVFTTLHSSYTLTVVSISQLFRLNNHRMLSYFILPLIFVIAMLPKNILQMYEVIQAFSKMGLIITFGYPFVLLMIAWIRKKRGSSSDLLPTLKKINLVIVLSLFITCLTGCWDRLEIEERMVVLGVAVDLASEEEAEKESNTTHSEGSFRAPHHNLIKVTVSVAVPGRLALGPGGAESGGGGGGKGGTPIWVLEIVGHSLDDALTDLEQQLEYELFFGHLRMIVVSEDFAKQGVRELSDYLRRDSNVRRTAWMAIGEGMAADYMNITPEIERIPTLYTVSTLDHAVDSGKLPQAFLGIFWSLLSSKGQDGYIPYIRIKEQQNVEIAGLAYFDGESMVGKTDPLEIGYFMSIMGMRNAGYKAVVPLGDATVTVQATSRHSRIKAEIRNGKPHFKIREMIEMQLTEKNDSTWSINESRELEKIEQVAEELAQKGHEKLIKTMQESRSDIFGFGEIVRAKHAKYWNKHVQRVEKWKELFPEVTFEVDVTFSIRRVGMKAR